MTRLHRSETGTQGARRIARAQIAEALQALKRQPLSDKAVHAARKSLKKARAMLRLLRPAIGGATYRRENAALRDIARPFSEIRDARVLLQTLDGLARRSRGSALPTGIGELQHVLRQERAAIRAKLLRENGSFVGPLQALREAHRRAGRWRVGRKGWAVLGAGLARVYGQGRRALILARADPTAARLHEWRKQTKYLWHQLQVLEPLGPAVARCAGLAHRLADTLGENHDLWVLRATVAVRVSVGAGRRQLLSLIDQRAEQLRAQAFALGRELYAETGTRFEARLHGLWRSWRRKPRRVRPA